MKHQYSYFVFLSVLSSVLLSAGFLFPHAGGFSLIGFVPLLIMDRKADECGVRHFFWWHYLCFVLWNAITTFWVCNATIAGGIFAILCNALFMSIIWALFRLFKKSFPTKDGRNSSALAYIFLAAAWIAWERYYYSAEVSWPWLTLGNAFATSTTCVQWYEITGTIGGSLWIWACNLSVFGLICAMQNGNWKVKWNSKARFAAGLATAILFVGPLAASWVRYATYKPQNDGKLAFAAFQPNFDPYEKFQSMSQFEQNDVMTSMMDSLLTAKDSLTPILLLAPETFTYDVILNRINASPTLFALRKHLAGHPNANMILGASTWELFYSDKAPSFTARPRLEGEWYEDHNSALIIDQGPRVGVYHKSRLVPGTEKMPWPRFFSKVDKALGGNVIARCTGQDQVSLLDFVQHEPYDNLPARTIPLGCAVCYESVYPEYFASYVKSGAKAMTVITNDAWWGDTPGYSQHLRYSALRAIETRRDIARCANTGISAFINSRGDIVSRTHWWQRETLEGELTLSNKKTPFVTYGDIAGRLCTFVCALLLLAAIVRRRILK